MQTALTLVVNNKNINDLIIDKMPLEELDTFIANHFNSEEELKNSDKYREKIGVYLYDNEYYLDEDDQGKIKIVYYFYNEKIYLNPIYEKRELEEYKNGVILSHIEEIVKCNKSVKSLIYQLYKDKVLNTDVILHSSNIDSKNETGKVTELIKCGDEYFNIRYIKEILDSYISTNNNEKSKMLIKVSNNIIK